MDMTPMSPTDRDAIGQLRALLRGDHHLSVEDEEQLIAGFLAGRIPALASSSGLQPTHLPSVQPVVIQAGVVSVATGLALALARFSGDRLYSESYRDGSQLGLVLVGMIFILAAPALCVLMGKRMSQAVRMVVAGMATTVGAGILEWAALHSPTNSPPAATENFVNGNLLALVLAILVLLWSAVQTWRHLPKPEMRGSRHPHTRRLASNGEATSLVTGMVASCSAGVSGEMFADTVN